MNINANELLLLNKKIKFGEGVNSGVNTSDGRWPVCGQCLHHHVHRRPRGGAV